jgi:HK97 family phage prohead protease
MSSLIEPASVPGLRHALTFKFDDIEFRKAQNGRSDNYTLRGHAAVFNSLSEDLGGFRELLAPGAFRASLRGTPDVRLLFNHDSNHVLARTTASIDGKPSLELREDKTGLHVWAVIQPRTWVNDLAIEMASGLIDQMSFAFTLREQGGDDWAVADDGTVVRTIVADGIERLFDVSVVTQPAYTDTEVGIRELRNAVASGRLPSLIVGEPADLFVPEPEERAADEIDNSPHDEIEVVAEEPAVPSLDDLRALTRGAVQAEKERHLHAMKELLK